MRAREDCVDFRKPRWIAGALVRPYDRACRSAWCCGRTPRERAGAAGVILGLAWKSLRNRRLTAALTVTSIGLAVALLLGVERIRDQSRESFASTISGTDLIVGARTSPVHLLLFSVFRIGDATNNIRWDSYRAIAARPEVAWTIPLALGDSHRGFRVL